MSAPNPVAAGHGYDQPYLCPPYLPGTYMNPSLPPNSIAASVGGGSSSVDNTATYISDPNAEGVKPPNTQANALAYSTNGQGQIYGWSIANQNWV